MLESTKMNNDSAKTCTCSGNKTNTYKAPIPGLEHILFEYGEKWNMGASRPWWSQWLNIWLESSRKVDQKQQKQFKNQKGKSTMNPMNLLTAQRRKNWSLLSTTSIICMVNQIEKKLLDAFLRNYHIIALQTWRLSYKVCPDGTTSSPIYFTMYSYYQIVMMMMLCFSFSSKQGVSMTMREAEVNSYLRHMLCHDINRRAKNWQLFFSHFV